MKAQLHWQGQMTFESEIRGHRHIVDAKAEHGGKELGPSPKEMLLEAIAGCTAMDVVSLMKKTRVEFEKFEIQIEAETTETHPKVFQEVRIDYQVIGQNPDLAKIQKAVDLSLTKYCGVSAMVSKVSPITYTITINGEKKAHGKARFWGEE